ncbi:hypothetical protein J6590_052977 [Homalodisca vitripennis]|nr:hypothetical protein J6590_052977 [Homalodisca vitripennis]
MEHRRRPTGRGESYVIKHVPSRARLPAGGTETDYDPTMRRRQEVSSSNLRQLSSRQEICSHRQLGNRLVPRTIHSPLTFSFINVLTGKGCINTPEAGAFLLPVFDYCHPEELKSQDSQLLLPSLDSVTEAEGSEATRIGHGSHGLSLSLHHDTCSESLHKNASLPPPLKQHNLLIIPRNSFRAPPPRHEPQHAHCSPPSSFTKKIIIKFSTTLKYLTKPPTPTVLDQHQIFTKKRDGRGSRNLDRSG